MACNKGAAVSDFVFALMIIFDFIGLVSIFAMLIFILHLLIAKFKPSLCYYDKRKYQDIDVNLLARRVSTKLKHLVLPDRRPSQKRCEWYSRFEFYHTLLFWGKIAI